MSVQDQIHMVAIIEIPISKENMIILSREQGAITVQLLSSKTRVLTLCFGVFVEYSKCV